MEYFVQYLLQTLLLGRLRYSKHIISLDTSPSASFKKPAALKLGALNCTPFHCTKGLFFVLFFGLLLWEQPASAQAPTISYPSVAQALTRGYSQSNLTVKLVFNGICPATVHVAFPPSVTYVAGSVSKAAGTAGLTITESDISNLARPEFSISGVTAVADEITFTVARRSACGTLATAKDSIYFIAGPGCSNTSELLGSVNNYNIFSPALSLTPPPTLTGAVIGTTATRTSTITNGGTGATDTVRFYIVYPGGGIVNSSGSNAVTANGTSFTPHRVNGDTLFYKFYGASLFGGDQQLDNSETVTVLEPIRVVKCNSNTMYSTAWGRNESDICERPSASSGMTMASGVANFNSATGKVISYIDKCTPFDFTLSMINNGSGDTVSAGMYDIRAKVGQHYSTANALLAVDTNMFMWSDVRLNGITIPAANVFWDANRNLNIELNNLFSTDPDGAGTGLADLDGDGFFDDLPGGDTLTLRLTQVFKCNQACGYNNVFQTTGATMAYRAMCDAAGTPRTLSGNVSAGIGYIYEGAFTGTAYVPANVIGGTPFRFQAKSSFYINSSSFSSSDTRYRWKIALPPGFSVSGTGAARYGTSSVTPSILSGGLSGVDTIVYTSTANALDSLSIDLVFNCGAGSMGGSTSIYYALEKINNITTGCMCGGKLFCKTISTSVFCPGPCPGGAGNFVPTVRRANGSLGWTDYTLATRQTASAISAYGLSKALYLDTIIVQCAARQGTAASSLHIELTLPKAAGGIEKLTPVRTVSSFYRSGALVHTCTTTTASGLASTATDQSLDWDLSPCLSGIPGGSLLAGDSIYSDVYYVVATNSLPTYDVQSGTRNIYYNLVAGVKQFCMDPVPEMYLAGTYATNATNTHTATACTPVVLGGGTNYYARRFGTAGTVFQNEFRPGMLIDSIIVTIPAGYDPTAFQYLANTGGASFSGITPTRIAGNQLTFVNPGWSAMGITVTNIYGANFYVTVTPTCATMDGEFINTKTFIRDYYYAYAGTPAPAGLSYILEGPSGVNRPISYFASSKPDISLGNQTGTVQGVSAAHSWTIRIGNPSLQTAPYVWLAVPDHSGISINSADNLTAGTTLTPLSYTGGKWYRVSTSGIASGSFIDVRLNFTYTACTMDSLKVYGGWNCSSYPASPATYTCGRDSLFLRIDPLPSQVQMSVSRQPGGGSSIPLCTADSTIIILNSAQAANLLSPYLTFFPPAGVSLLTPVRVEYPRGSGNYQDAGLTSLPGGGYQINLNAHTDIGSNGMPGTANANPSYTPAGGDRQARIAVRFTTDCNFTSGTSFRFNGMGSRTCGAAALGNGAALSTNALNITGASATGSAGISISFGSVSSFNCGESTALGLSTIPTSAPTQAGDTMVYTLPQGLSYAGGFARSANCSSCEIDTVAGPSGTTIVKVKLQTGVSSGSVLACSFAVRSAGEACGAVNITGSFKRDIPPLSCGGTPCSNSSVIIANGVSSDITLNKPNLPLSNVRILNSPPVWQQADFFANRVRVFYSNDGSQAYAANTDTIEFFCNSSATTPFAKMPLTKNVPIGASDSDEYSIMMPLGSCTMGDAVTARIRTQTASGTLQCLCSPSMFTMAGVALPLDFLETAISVQDCAVQLNWQYNDAVAVEGFEIESGSSDGSSYKTVGSTDGTGRQYRHIVPEAGTWYYRIKALLRDGGAVYTPTLRVRADQCNAVARIYIYPNPAQSLLHVVVQDGDTEAGFELSDMLGRVLMKSKLQLNTDNTLALDNLAAGTYLVRVTSNQQVHTQQIQIRK